MNVYLSLFFLHLFLFPVANYCTFLENDFHQGPMSKKLHNFDLKGLQWSTLGRPRGSVHNNEDTPADVSKFFFKSGANDFEKVNETAPSKLADSLRNLTIPRANDGVPSRGKGLERRVQKGKQVKKEDVPCGEDDVVKGAQLLSKRRESKKPLSGKDSDDSDDVILTKIIEKTVQKGGSGNSEGAKRWNLRDRRSIRLSKEAAGSSNPSAGSSTRGFNEKLADLHELNSGSKGIMEMPVFPNFSLSLTKEEVIEDLTIMLGKPPPKKVKKRPRNVQRHVDFVFPGMNLGNITLGRYEVQEKPPTGKGK